jgi:hypothetical protein
MAKESYRLLVTYIVPIAVVQSGGREALPARADTGPSAAAFYGDPKFSAIFTSGDNRTSLHFGPTARRDRRDDKCLG